MKIKVVSSGTPRGLKAFNSETGEQILGFHKLEVDATAGEIATVRLTFILDNVECIAGMEPIKPNDQ